MITDILLALIFLCLFWIGAILRQINVDYVEVEVLKSNNIKLKKVTK